MSDQRHLNPITFQRNNLGYQEEFLKYFRGGKNRKIQIVKNHNLNKRFSKTFFNYVGVLFFLVECQRYALLG